MKRSSNLYAKAGQALERGVGLKVSSKEGMTDIFARNRNTMNVLNKRPTVALGTFIAPNANVVGNTLISTHSSVWYGAVIRADKAAVVLGPYSNIQDRAVVNTVNELKSGFSPNVIIGNHVSIGHGAILTSCVIEDVSSIGAGSVISEGCVIERHCIVAPGSVLAANTFIPEGQYWAGNPAKYIRDVGEDEVKENKMNAKAITLMSEMHDDEFLQCGQTYIEAEKLQS